jgi:hypothetical protein
MQMQKVSILVGRQANELVDRVLHVVNSKALL